MSTQMIEAGKRYVLPSGHEVEAVSEIKRRIGWEFVYLFNGELPSSPGRANKNLVTLRVNWFLKHATEIAQ